MDSNNTIDQDRILKINIEEEMKSSYIDYSMSVIVARALPDVRDGFKPVHRRIHLLSLRYKLYPILLHLIHTVLLDLLDLLTNEEC